MSTDTGHGNIPVTILSGSLGAGKTTLLNHLLAEADNRRIAVLVNDMGTVNVDAELIAEGSELDVDDGVAELSNGCICCELQDDLETAVVRLARDQSFDHLVVEPSGISEPAPIARLFTTESRVAARYDVDCIVCVLDTPYFLEMFSGGEVERRGEEGDRPLSDLLVEQVETANVVLLNKTDRCSDEELERAAGLVAGLQPDVETIPTEFSDVDPDLILDTGRFDRGRMQELPAWKRLLEEDETEGEETEGEETTEADGHRDRHDRDHDHNHGHDNEHDHEHDHAHPDEVYGVDSFTYRRRQPFDPEHVAAVLRELPPSIVRAKGTVWIAGIDLRITLSVAGPSVRATAQGPWLASLPEIEREMYRSNRPELEWHKEHGDRRTELVFIGTEYDRDAIETALDGALVDPSSGTGAAPDGGPFPVEAGEETVLRE
ncbi:GTP-binding protein [Natronomonas sp. F2-12]|jgi:G3E family GTPase|uniref:GTP-binding protein n=1 Tax=Natronomonas aquatica TaxID=2841590 RepID=A0A9R1D701_9EURY|nr:GTP-binding protein [Natronomonas aquatica]MCQ4334048.1 GTP-binding protein [Natronomonas aquatica]